MKNYKIISKKPNILWMQDKVIDEYQRINTESYRVEELEMEDILSDSPCKIQKLDNITNFISHITGFETEKYIKYVAKGNEFIRIVNLNEFFINTEDVKYIDESIYNILTKYHLGTGDILLSKDGTIGVASIVDEGNVKSIASSHVVTIKSKKEEIDPYYLVTFLNSKYGQFQFARMSTGSIQKALNVEKIRGTKIPVPCKNIQKYIGDKVRKAEELREEAKIINRVCERELKKLLNLDENELLYNNNAGNSSLEYNNYPIINYISSIDIGDRLDAKYYHPELYNTLNTINKLDFKCLSLKEVLESYSTGKSSPDYMDEGVPIIMTKNIKNHDIDWQCKKVSESSINKSEIVNKEDVLLTTYGGSSIGKVDLLFDDILCTFDYTILKLKFDNNSNPYFMTLLLRSKIVQNQIRYLIKGTTGITFVIPNEILDIKIPIIEKNIQDDIGVNYKKSLENLQTAKILIKQAKQDVEDLIEGNFDMSKIKEGN